MANINQTPRDKNGKEHGEWLSYYDNGQLSFHENYVHGITHGLWKSYHSDGRLHAGGHYNMGRRVGYWYYLLDSKFYYLCLI